MKSPHCLTMSAASLLFFGLASSLPAANLPKLIRLNTNSPGRVFEGRLSTLGAAVDPNTHRVMARCEIADPKNELRPGMLASFIIRVQDPIESVAIPMAGVVRNGDGTMAAWVTTDRHRFLQTIIKIGLQRDGQYQVLEGLQRGQMAVTDGAIFLSNMLQAPPSD